MNFIPIVLFSCFLLLANPGTAAAYLDPSAGNALVYIAVTLAGVLAYAAKGVFYRLVKLWNGKGGEGGAAARSDGIALFSEGKNYWNTFETVVKALIARGQPFSYYTMDMEDPGLKINNPLMRSQYIGEGSAAYARLNRVACRVMLATTPNIGTPGYHLPRPAKVEFLFHVFHGSEGVSSYKKGALDCYDGVGMVGSYAAPALRYLEEKRGLPAKELVPLGLPYWDGMLQQAEAYQAKLGEAPRPERRTLLLAPSWSEKGFLSHYDTGFIKSLASEFNLILRPHPQSWISEPGLLNRVKKELEGTPNITWDEASDPAPSLAASDLLISDTSGVRMDYAVIYKKPVVSLEVKVEDVSSFERAELPAEYVDSLADKVCVPIRAEEIGNINAIVRAALAGQGALDLDAFVRENIANLGTAGEHVADYLIQKCVALSEATAKENVKEGVEHVV